FEDAVEAIEASIGAIETLDDGGDRLSAAAGALGAGWFRKLDDPELLARRQAVVRALADAAIAAPVRARAGLAALGYYEARASLDNLLWVELAMRPVLADPAVGRYLVDEWHHMLVQGL